MMFPKVVLLLSTWAVTIPFCASLTISNTRNQWPIGPPMQVPLSSAEQEQSSNPDFHKNDIFGLKWHTDWSLPGTDPLRKSRLSLAFVDAMELANTAAEAAVNPKTNFLVKKYLGDIDEVRLKNMLTGMLGKVQRTGADRLKPIHWRQTDYHNACSTQDGDKVMAYTSMDGPGERAIVICDHGFTGLRDLPKITCTDLKWSPNKDEAILSSEKMHSLASIVFHELMHANSEIEPQPLGIDQDVDDLSIELPNKTRPKVYGPRLTQYFAKQAPGLAKRNADNWTWLALEAYWQKNCPNLTFLDPHI